MKLNEMKYFNRRCFRINSVKKLQNENNHTIEHGQKCKIICPIQVRLRMLDERSPTVHEQFNKIGLLTRTLLPL